jgi:acetate---CoA ligase (ADP-forming)
MTMSSSAASGTPTFTPERLRSLFEPRSIALIGASDKSAWSMMIHGGLRAAGYTGRVYYVNPRAETVHGQPTVAGLAAIGEPVDLAYVMVPPDAVLPVFQEIVAAGIHNAIVLTAGFGEAGAAGQQRQRELSELAYANDIAIIGPNCLGYINVTQQIVAMPTTCKHPIIAGPVAIVSQSGAIGAVMLNYANEQNIGLSALISTGNEAVVSVTEAIDYLVDHEPTRVIAVFMETVRHPAEFVRVARRAFAAGKPIVALKAGRGVLSARVAQAHTGALVGDDQVIDALFRQLGIIRVESLEELVLSANLIAQIGPLRGNRLGFVAISGGACDLAADLAEQMGIDLPEFAEATRAGLRELLPAAGAAYNPLDVTGAAISNRELFGNMLKVIGQDPNLDALVCVMGFPTDDSPMQQFIVDILSYIAGALHEITIPAFMADTMHFAINDVTRHTIERTGLPVLPGGIQQVLTALGKAMRWWERRRAYHADQRGTVEDSVLAIELGAPAAGAWSEHQTRQLLDRYGIPVIPARLATSADASATAARELGFPVALKIVSPDILHKSDIGGVQLHLRDEDAVHAAFVQVLRAAEALSPAPQIEGALVSPMRAGGVELLVGVVRDPDWGQVLAVGMGGIFVEVLQDASLRVLPIARDEVRAMLGELQGAALLRGARGATPADLDRLVDVIYRIGVLAQALGDGMESLEINPLRVDGAQIEALDALITWRGEGVKR